MREGLRFGNLIVLSAIVLAALGISLGYWTGDSRITTGVLLGSVVSLFNVAWGFYSIRWAFQRSSRTFLSVLVGGMFLRFLVVGAALFWAWKQAGLHFMSFVAALLGSYFLLQILEIRFIQQRLANKASKSQ